MQIMYIKKIGLHNAYSQSMRPIILIRSKTKIKTRYTRFLTADTRAEYKKWKWLMKSKIRICNREAIEYPETLFDKKVLYSSEGNRFCNNDCKLDHFR